jgi:hypothetical protein
MAEPRRKPVSAAERARRERQKKEAAGQEELQEKFQAVYAEPDEEVSTGASWKKQSQGEKIVTPSGQVVLARRVGMEVLLRQGHIPNALMPIVRKYMSEGGQGKEISDQAIIADVLNDAEQLTSLMEMYDNVTMAVVVKPRLVRPPIDPETKEIVPDDQRPDTDAYGNDIAYLDWVSQEDKAYLMHFAVGGTRNIERFRNEKESMETVLDGGKVPLPTE